MQSDHYRRLSVEQKVQLAEEAKLLLAPGSMFNKIVTALTAECMEELIQNDVGSLTATRAHGTMKGLNEIKGRLQVLVNDAIVATKPKKTET